MALGKRAQKAIDVAYGLSSDRTQAPCAHVTSLLNFLLYVRSNVHVDVRYGGSEL